MLAYCFSLFAVLGVVSLVLCFRIRKLERRLRTLHDTVCNPVYGLGACLAQTTLDTARRIQVDKMNERLAKLEALATTLKGTKDE
jgi:hypothetical protein